MFSSFLHQNQQVDFKDDLDFYSELFGKIGQYIIKNPVLHSEHELYVKNWFHLDEGGSPERYGDDRDMLFLKCLSSFIHESTLPSGKDVLAYIQAYSKDYFTVQELKFMEKMQKSFYSVFEVMDISQNSFLHLKDVLTRKEYDVWDEVGSESLAAGELVLCRVMRSGNRYMVIQPDNVCSKVGAYLLERLIEEDRDILKKNGLSSLYIHENMEPYSKNPEDLAVENVNFPKRVKNIFKKIYGKKFKVHSIEDELKSINFENKFDPILKKYLRLIGQKLPSYEQKRASEDFLEFVTQLQQGDATKGKKNLMGEMEKILHEVFLKELPYKTNHITDDAAAEAIADKLFLEWLDESQQELQGKTPREVILSERRENGNQSEIIEGHFSRKKIEKNNVELQKEYDSMKKQAMGFMKNGEFEKALPLFQELVSVDPENYIDTFNIGGCYFYLGDIDLARKYTQKALDLNKDYIHALHLIYEIDHLNGAQKRVAAKLKTMTQAHSDVMVQLDKSEFHDLKKRISDVESKTSRE